MPDYYSKFYPKTRTGKECKKVNCARYPDYIEWRLGNSNLKFCMECKNAYVSQYTKETHNAKG